RPPAAPLNSTGSQPERLRTSVPAGAKPALCPSAPTSCPPRVPRRRRGTPSVAGDAARKPNTNANLRETIGSIMSIEETSSAVTSDGTSGTVPPGTVASHETAAAAGIQPLAINAIRTLSMDAVQAANSGHPGTPMALAPVAYTIWQQFLRYDPA